MKKIFLILLFFEAIAQSTEITLPEADILKCRLTEAGFEHFVEKTALVEAMAGKQWKVSTMVEAIQAELRMYCRFNGMMAILAARKKSLLIEAFLKDSPEALKELEEAGLFKE